LKIIPPSECPNIKNHTKSPEGYNQWQAWAEKKSKTHDQLQCPDCGYYVIWIKRKKEDKK